MKSFGFKEWALVCDALGRGEQTVILRKGGIAEGRAGFAFKHDEFYLFPTFFHEQLERTRLTQAKLPLAISGEIALTLLAKVAALEIVRDWSVVEALEPFHILQESVVRERFEYDDFCGIHVAFLRVFRLEPAWILPDAKEYGGCRSWVELPDAPAETRLVPVLSDADFAARQKQFANIVNRPATAAR